MTRRVSCNLQQSLANRPRRAVVARVWPLCVKLITAWLTPAVRNCPFLEKSIYLVDKLTEAKPCGARGKIRAPVFTRLRTVETIRLLGTTERIKPPVGLANRDNGRPILTPLDTRINVFEDRRSGH